MQMDLQVKISPDIILEVAKELNEFKCLRKKVVFELWEGVWKYRYVCDGFGNGYGVGCCCDETCKLRIVDITKSEWVEDSYWVQPEFYYKNIQAI